MIERKILSSLGFSFYEENRPGLRVQLMAKTELTGAASREPKLKRRRMRVPYIFPRIHSPGSSLSLSIP